MNAEDVRSMPCSASLPWIEEPTRAGWWVAWIYSSPKMFHVAELTDREGLHAFHQGFWRTPREIHAAGWAGPFESPSAPVEKPTQNDGAKQRREPSAETTQPTDHNEH